MSSPPATSRQLFAEDLDVYLRLRQRLETDIPAAVSMRIEGAPELAQTVRVRTLDRLFELQYEVERRIAACELSDNASECRAEIGRVGDAA